MYKTDGSPELPVSLPGKNEAITYFIQYSPNPAPPEKLSIYPLLEEGKTCELSDFLDVTKLPDCP